MYITGRESATIISAAMDSTAMFHAKIDLTTMDNAQ